jgi:ribosomal protein S18 acetylase RimI-like enzyme
VEIRCLQGRLPGEVLGLVASVMEPTEAALIVSLWDASCQRGDWTDWRAAAAYDRGEIVGAIVGRLQPGRVAAVWPPLVAPRHFTHGAPLFVRNAAISNAGDEPPPSENDNSAEHLRQRLLAELLDDFRRSGATLAQAILPRVAATDAAPFVDGGFTLGATLLHLVCGEETWPQQSPASPFSFRHYAAADEALLGELLEASYIDTQDCPALNGWRTATEVLAGYRGTGSTDTDCWRIICRGTEAVGCLLVAGHMPHPVAELVYVGVVPQGRGQGIGQAATREAQWLARQLGAEQLVLTVDEANAPARRIYERLGFQAWDCRQVFLRRLT